MNVNYDRFITVSRPHVSGWAQGIRAAELPVNGLMYSFYIANADASGEPLLLLHGFRDSAQSFVPLISSINHDGPILVCDWRGHGDSSWIPTGGSYHFMDYVADLNSIVTQLAQPTIRIIAHSMGGVVSTYLCGARPNLVSKLTLIEAVGPPGDSDNDGIQRVRTWLDERDSGVETRPITREKARSKLCLAHPTMPASLMDEYVKVMTRPHTDDSDLVRWHFDPRLRWRNPYPFREENFRYFANAISCPVDIIIGGTSYMANIDYMHQRHTWLRPNRETTIPDAGHMVHLDQPRALVDAINA